MSRSSEDFQRHDGLQIDHLFGTDGGVQQRHPRVETSNHRPEDMGTLQAFNPPSTSITEKSGNNCRKRGTHRGGAKHTWCTAPPYRRSQLGDKLSTHYHPSNADSGIQYISTGSSQ